MNTAITLENLYNPAVLFPEEVKRNSNSLISDIDKVIEETQELILMTGFLNLKNNIGEELFNKLSYDQKVFMIETSGSIDFGHAIDLNRISQEIKEYDI